MKMSEFTTKSFLGNAGAAENSYILINYEDNTTQRPVTYKASLQEIGKAIANDQKLYKKTQNGAVTTNVSQGAYVNTAAENFASTGAVTAAVSGLASTGYVTAAVANAGSAAGFTNPGDIPVYVAGSEGQLRWYNWENPSDCTPYSVIKTNNAYILAYDATNDQIGYFADISDTTLTSIAIGGDNNKNNLYGYIQAAASLAGQYRLQFQEEGKNGPTDVTPEMIGAASTGDLSGLASTGYVANKIADLTSTGGFNPAESVTCSVGRYTANDSYVSEGTHSLYPAMIADYSGVQLYIQSQTDAGKFIYGGIIASESDLNGMACISTSDNKPCIRNRDQEFIGFLSTT